MRLGRALVAVNGVAPLACELPGARASTYRASAEPASAPGAHRPAALFHETSLMKGGIMRSSAQSTAGFAVLVSLLFAGALAQAQGGPVNSYSYDETGNLLRQQLACTPATCAALGKNCGNVSDGCGGTLSCGNCPAGQVCTTSHVCCTPTTTCAALGAECGSISNGCGGTESCGTCPTGYYCVGGACDTSTCFVAGTPITMADGSSKPIEEIAAGDAVLSFDPESGTLVEGRVERLLEHPTTPALVRVNGSLTTTPEHRFFVEGAWVRADQLRLGDRLMRPWPDVGTMDAGPGFAVIRRLESLPGDVTTYNFDVAPFHDYFAGGVLVHNIKGDP